MANRARMSEWYGAAVRMRDGRRRTVCLARQRQSTDRPTVRCSLPIDAPSSSVASHCNAVSATAIGESWQRHRRGDGDGCSLPPRLLDPIVGSLRAARRSEAGAATKRRWTHKCAHTEQWTAGEANRDRARAHVNAPQHKQKKKKKKIGGKAQRIDYSINNRSINMFIITFN